MTKPHANVRVIFSLKEGLVHWVAPRYNNKLLSMHPREAKRGAFLERKLLVALRVA